MIDHYSRTGNALSASFFHLITSDALALALSDAVLVGASFGALAFAHGMRKGWWAYGWPVMAVQHVLQTAYLMTTVVWTFNRSASLSRRAALERLAPLLSCSPAGRALELTSGVPSLRE